LQIYNVLSYLNKIISDKKATKNKVLDIDAIFYPFFVGGNSVG